MFKLETYLVIVGYSALCISLCLKFNGQVPFKSYLPLLAGSVDIDLLGA